MADHPELQPHETEEHDPNRPVPLDDTNAVRDAIAERYGMTELLGEDGGPAIRLKLRFPPHAEAGWMRIWETPADCAIDRLYHIWVGGQGNDVNLMYAMTRADSPVPHFFLHYNVNPPAVWSYHIDLPGKVDPVMYPDYWQQAFSPLSEMSQKKTYKSIAQKSIQADRKQYLSTWGFYGKEVDQDEYILIRDNIVQFYLQHFFELVDNFSYDTVSRDYLIERGRKQQDMLLAREMDLSGWGRLESLFGREAGDELRHECRREHHAL